MWQKLFIIVAVLLSISLAIAGTLWYHLEETEGKLARVLGRYATFKKEIDVRFGQWQDVQGYITADDPVVAAKVQEITGGYSPELREWWDDCERMYRWVAGNIEYSTDSPTPLLPELVSDNLTWRQDFWRMPAETLEEGVGDCEDMALLLASMLLSYNKNNLTVWILGIQSYEPEYRGHVAVAFPVAGGLFTILDPAAKYYTHHYDGGEVRAYTAALVVDDWIKEWSEKLPRAEVYMVASKDYYYRFSNTEEFLRWISEP